MSLFDDIRRRLSRKSSFEPCLPRPAKAPPTGAGWIHEIKHDGFRIIGWREGSKFRLITRNGRDFSNRFPLVALALNSLSVRSCIIDGEAIARDDDGLSVFDLLRYRRNDHLVSLCAFDLLELNGQDMRNEPIEIRKSVLKKLLRHSRPGLAYNRHFDVEGSIVFHHACKLGCEGIVSKRLGSPYRAGWSSHWLKIKNTAAPAVKREAEEDWGDKRWGRGRKHDR